MVGKRDKSFNQSVYNGVEKFAKESGTKYRKFEVTNATQREWAIHRMAQRGVDPVLGVGFARAQAFPCRFVDYVPIDVAGVMV
ncbi:MAG: BMP family ABC transporter substrate-binding protein [Alphaproteobacteria bacterium]|nr:BMP family ABC transporter substrate-binding protein [Alphaproteobacteria bacterium]